MNPVRYSTEHWALLAFAPLALLSLVLVAVFLEPDPRGFGTHEQLGLPACKTMEWFDFPCPGCGVTTSACLTARGRPFQALSNQPLGFLLVALVPIYAVWAVRGHARGHDLYGLFVLRSRRWLTWFGLAVLAAWAWKIRQFQGGG